MNKIILIVLIFSNTVVFSQTREPVLEFSCTDSTGNAINIKEFYWESSLFGCVGFLVLSLQKTKTKIEGVERRVQRQQGFNFSVRVYRF